MKGAGKNGGGETVDVLFKRRRYLQFFSKEEEQEGESLKMA